MLRCFSVGGPLMKSAANFVTNKSCFQGQLMKMTQHAQKVRRSQIDMLFGKPKFLQVLKLISVSCTSTLETSTSQTRPCSLFIYEQFLYRKILPMLDGLRAAGMPTSALSRFHPP